MADHKEEEVPEFLSDEAVAKHEAEEAAAKRQKRNKSKKHKTFNQLDEQFQLTEDHDLDHIFPEELEMVKELRKRIPVLQFYSEKWIVYFLCARRHDLDEVEILLNKYFTILKEYKLEKHAPSVQNNACKKLMEQRSYFKPIGALDKHGRNIEYYWFAKNLPGHPASAFVTFYFLELELDVLYTPLAVLRNGVIWVGDMTGISLFKNFDFSAEGRAWSRIATGTFPKRVRGIYVANAPFFVRGLMQAAKLILPKKLTKRIKFVNKDDIKELIHENFLLQMYGGKIQHSEELLQKEEEKLFELEAVVKKHWRARRKQIRAWEKANAPANPATSQ